MTQSRRSTTREEIEAHFKPSCSGLVEIVFSAPGKVGAIGVAKRQKYAPASHRMLADPCSRRHQGCGLIDPFRPQHGGRVWFVFKDVISVRAHIFSRMLTVPSRPTELSACAALSSRTASFGSRSTSSRTRRQSLRPRRLYLFNASRNAMFFASISSIVLKRC